MGGIAAALLALSPCAAVGEIGPALTGLTDRANDATSVFFSPTGITRLDRPELVTQATFMYQESKFDVQASFAGGDSDKDSRVFTIPAAYYSPGSYSQDTPSLYPYRLDRSIHAADGLDNGIQSYTGMRISVRFRSAFCTPVPMPVGMPSSGAHRGRVPWRA